LKQTLSLRFCFFGAQKNSELIALISTTLFAAEKFDGRISLISLKFEPESSAWFGYLLGINNNLVQNVAYFWKRDLLQSLPWPLVVRTGVVA
jgi:hypothetical protein